MSTTEWQRDLSLVISKTLRALLPSLRKDSLAMLALDCQPWDGGLFLAVLTKAEVDVEPTLADSAEMAAWKHYDCGSNSDQWSVESLCETMKRDYDAANDHEAIAEAYLRSCAAALSDELVSAALEDFQLASDFRVSVTHPDDGTEYCEQE